MFDDEKTAIFRLFVRERFEILTFVLLENINKTNQKMSARSLIIINNMHMHFTSFSSGFSKRGPSLTVNSFELSMSTSLSCSFA